MRNLTLAMTIVMAMFAQAKDKRPTSDYSEAVLRSAKTVQSGMNCRSSGSITPVGNDANIDTSGSCRATTHWEYVLVVGNQTYTLVPDHRFEFLPKTSVLCLQPGGAKMLFRIDAGKHTAYVRIESRESKYRVVGIE